MLYKVLLLSLFIVPFTGFSQACDCPEAGTCGPCAGGLTSYALKYNGIVPGLVQAVDNSGTFYTSVHLPGDVFILNGTLPNGKFQGPDVTVKIDGVVNAVLNTNCGATTYVGDIAGDFEIKAGSSKDGGLMCCAPAATESNPPVITNCPSGINSALVGSTCTQAVTWALPSATDDCTLASFTSDHQSGDQFSIGTTLVTYTATDGYGNEAFCSFNVVVNDASPPVISNCPSDIVINASENCDAVVSWNVPTATDNCAMASFTNSHIPGSTFPIGETEVTYTASDVSGNISVCQFKVIVTNQQLPEITNCPSDITADSDINEGTGNVTWEEPLATVACGNVLLTSTHQPGSDFPVGTTTVEYTAESEDGNKATCSFNVTINFIATAVKVSKVITPDGDGFNDVWRIDGIEEFADNHVTVIDRWGSVIYETSGYDNTNVVWDGANQSGVNVPTGTYFYTLEIKAFGSFDKRKGFIELIR